MTPSVVRQPSVPAVQVSVARIEHHREAIGIGESTPRLSWQVDAAPPSWRQAAYEVEVDGAGYRVESPQSVLVPWPAAPLRSRERRTVRVRVWAIRRRGVAVEPAGRARGGLLGPPTGRRG